MQCTYHTRVDCNGNCNCNENQSFPCEVFGRAWARETNAGKCLPLLAAVLPFAVGFFYCAVVALTLFQTSDKAEPLSGYGEVESNEPVTSPLPECVGYVRGSCEEKV